MTTATERRHLAWVAEQPCIACGSWPVEVHHCRHNLGMGQRRRHSEAVPLCPMCHRLGPVSRHGQGAKEFRETHGNDRELLRRFCDQNHLTGVKG